MTGVTDNARAGVSLADFTYDFMCACPSRPSGSRLAGEADSLQGVDSAGPALTQAAPAEGQPVQRAKRARSPQGRLTAFDDEGQFLCKRQKTEQEKEDDGDESETTDEELLSCLEARTREVQATTRQLQAETQQLQAAAHAMRSRQQQRKERRKHQAMMEKWNREILYGGLANVRIQALREDGRLRALAHVGITRSAISPKGRPWGKRITALVDDWEGTHKKVLTKPQKREIIVRFGPHFLSFLRTDAFLPGPRHMLSLDMPWGERAFIMEAIDDLPDEAVREGARSAYLAFVKSTSWEEAQNKTATEPAARYGHV